MKKLFSLLTIICASIFFAGEAHGQSECKVVYGGGEVCTSKIQYSVDKKIQMPISGDYVEDLSADSVRKYRSGELANFKIIIKNTSDTAIEAIDVTDIIAEFTEFYAGPGVVKTDNGKTTVTFTVKNLGSGKTVEYFITVKVKEESSWSSGSKEEFLCRKNTVRTVALLQDTREDSSQICFERGVLGVGTTSIPTSKGGITPKPTPAVFSSVKGATQTPPTGPEILGIAALIPTGLLGFILKKRKLQN